MLVFLPHYRTRAITGTVGDSAPRVTISKVATASFQPGEAPAFTDSKGGAFPCAHGSSSLTSPGKLAVLKAQTLVLPTLTGTLPAGAELPTHSVRLASAPWPQGPLTALPNPAAWSPIFESMSLSLPFHVTCEIPQHASPFTSGPCHSPHLLLCMCRPPLTHPSPSRQSHSTHRQHLPPGHTSWVLFSGKSPTAGGGPTAPHPRPGSHGGTGRGFLLWFLGFPRQGCLTLPSGLSSPESCL